MKEVFVKEEQIIEAKSKCELLVSDLEDEVKKYSDNASEIDSVIRALKHYYDTEGGDKTIREIESVNTLGKSVESIGEWASGIKVSYGSATRVSKVSHTNTGSH